MARDFTLRYFEEGRADAVEQSPSIHPTPPNRMAIKELGWHTHQGITSWDGFAGNVRDSALPEATFFLDSSFLNRDEIPRVVWEALLSRKIAITPLVWIELQDWINRPFANSWFRDLLLDARSNGNPSILFLDPLDWPEEIRESARYYVSLLSARKIVGLHLRGVHLMETGREPSSMELKAAIQRLVGDRGLVLAEKGLVDFTKDNFSTDEGVVVGAVVHAIVTGHESTILTRDKDIPEQFRKFNFLFDTHYRCALIAQSFQETPENLITVDGLLDDTAGGLLATGPKSALSLPRRFTEWVLPKSPDHVLVYCCRFAASRDHLRIARLSFCAQREMVQVLKFKGKSAGRNYELPDRLNCHLAVSPPFTPALGAKAVIATDQEIELGPFRGPTLDLHYSLLEVQRFRRSIVDPSATLSGVTQGIQLADFFQPERLKFSTPPEWCSLPWSELTKAIRFFDAAGVFFIDRDVMPILHPDCREVIFTRGFNWSKSIRDEAVTAKSSENFTPNERAHLNKKFAFEIPKHAPYEYGFGHYVGLLALRKLFGKVIRARVRKEYGRESSDAEIAAIAEYYSGVRGRRLAEFGEAASNDPLAFAGEELLVTGAIFAILEGTDVVFLTRDPLFMDQFTELGRLLLGDYVACEFGRQYVQNPSGFPARVLPNDSSQPLEFFVGDVMAWRFKNGWQREILPRRPYPMNLHCWLLGRDEGDAVRFAALSVNVERPMHNLLRVKGATGGRNIDGLDGKNVRVGFENGVDTGVAMIGKERMVAVGKTEIPADDRLHLGVSSFAAADIAGLHSARDQIVAPWHENAS